MNVVDLRGLAPQVLGALVRRYGDFSGAEDAVQEALVAATTSWPEEGTPDDPLAWLIRVAQRRLANQYRADDARRRREDLASSWSVHVEPDPLPEGDDTLLLMLLCCHPMLSPATAIPLTLRAVGGLTTRQIATAFLVPEATMAQRISRAKAKLRELDEPFRRPPDAELPEQLRSVRHVLYLLANEGHVTSTGPELDRPDLGAESIRLARLLLDATPDEAESRGLLALLLLTEARRPARTTDDGALVPLAEQDRARWDRELIREGLLHATAALQAGRAGEYTLQAAINALHVQARSSEATRWADIAVLYDRLERLTGNPMVRLNRAAAVAMVDGPHAALALIADLDDALGAHHRLLSVRAHLHERAGDRSAAIEEFRAAAAGTGNARERDHLLRQAARLRALD